MDNKHTGTQDPRGQGPVKGRQTKATKAALLAAVVVGSWWQPRDSASRRGPKLLVPREIVEMADAGYGMRARLSPGYEGGKSTWITVRLLLSQYRLCDRPRPVEPIDLVRPDGRDAERLCADADRLCSEVRSLRNDVGRLGDEVQTATRNAAAARVELVALRGELRTLITAGVRDAFGVSS